jgi:sodium/hydrogen antiporter
MLRAMHDFDVATLVLGGVLLTGALLSALAHRSFLSLTAIFVLAGFLLGPGGVHVLRLDARSGFVEQLALVALIVILFRDGLEVEQEMLRREWRLPLRKLILAMPVTGGLVALAGHVIVGLPWKEAGLLGALLASTDPVLSSAVVTNPRVPRVLRHSLNLESGLNDGLALTAVLAFSDALKPGSGGFDPVTFVLKDVGIGLVTGLLVAYAAARLLPRATVDEEQRPAHQHALYALGVAFVAYGLAVLPPHGNGLIAVFVCAIAFGLLRPDVQEVFEERSEELVELVKLGIFLVFGSLLTLSGLFADGLAAVAVAVLTLVVARPVAVFAALAGTRVSRSAKLFMAWFGPRGVATMAFGLLVLGKHVPGGERVFQIAALTVLLSVIAHGLTDTPGVEWIAARSQEEDVGGAAPPASTASGEGG